jgi:glycosyltransferase involved in cell wall biosynthesis
MRVLSIHSLPPYPPDTGLRNRNWHLVAELARHADVTVLAWAPPDFPASHVDTMRAAGVDVVLLPMTTAGTTRRSRVRRQARFIAGGPPPYVTELLEQRGLDTTDGRTRLRNAVLAAHAEIRFDVVLVMEEAMSFAPLPKLRLPLAVARHNVFSQVVGDLRSQRALTRAAWQLERRPWRRYDVRSSAAAGLTVMPTEESATALGRLLPQQPIEVVPNGVALPAHAVERGRDVVFVGWMGYPANVDAVRWFADEVWPAVYARHRDSTFRIVGREPTAAVRDLARRPGVVVTGEVADVAGACAGAAVAVAPLRAGMGIKTKTLESLAMGLPVVATAVGAEGLDGADGLVRCDQLSELVHAVDLLLSSPDRAASMGEAGRRFAAGHAWSAAGDRLAAVLRAIA